MYFFQKISKENFQSIFTSKNAGLSFAGKEPNFPESYGRCNLITGSMNSIEHFCASVCLGF